MPTTSTERVYRVDGRPYRWDPGKAARRRKCEVGEHKRIAQGEVARQLGVSRQTVNAWERGGWPPDESRLEHLARLYHCTVLDLVTPVDQMMLEQQQAP